jgi:hypothetical protein
MAQPTSLREYKVEHDAGAQLAVGGRALGDVGEQELIGARGDEVPRDEVLARGGR